MSWRKLEEWFFPPRSTTWISILRVGLGLQLALYALSLWRDWNYLFAGANAGLIDRNLSEAILSLDSPFLPRLGWLVGAGHELGLTEEPVLALCRWGLLIAGFLLMLGFLSRSSAIAGWILHLAVRGSGGFITYGVDQFMTIGLFYLAIAPLPDRYSLDRLLRQKKRADPHRIGFHLRLLQVHLCLIYFFAGLTKSLGAGWWNGTSLWRALTRPPFNIIDWHLLLHWSSVLPLAGILICLLEIGYPVFIWLRFSRGLWLAAIMAMHIGIGVLMGLHLFALIMVILNAAAFGPDFLPGATASRPASSRVVR